MSVFGSIFPDISLPLVGGGRAQLRADDQPKLLVVYRGAFCPFCRVSLQEVNSKVAALREAGIDVIAFSADKEDVATALVSELSLSFPVAYGLTEDTMHQLGLYVSDPTNYIEQTHRFSEPGYFFLTATSRIQCNSLKALLQNIDNLIAGYQWSMQRIKESPDFAKAASNSGR